MTDQDQINTQQPAVKSVTTSAVDMAMTPELIKLTMMFIIIGMVPSFFLAWLGSAISPAVPAILIPLWLIICLNCLSGGMARMTGITLNESRSAHVDDGLKLIKKRWLPLMIGPFFIGFLVIVLMAAISWVITLISGVQIIGALITIPVFLFLFIGFAIIMNIYLFCVIIGYDDSGLKAGAAKLMSISIKSPYQLWSNLFNVLKTLLPIMILSGAMVIACLAITILLTIGDAGSLFGGGFSLPSMLQNLKSFTGFVGSIRLASILFIVFSWVSFLTNIVIVSYTFSYHESSAKQ